MPSILQDACEPGGGQTRPYDATKNVVFHFLSVRHAARDIHAQRSSLEVDIRMCRRQMTSTRGMRGMAKVTLHQQASIDVLKVRSRVYSDALRELGSILLELAPTFDAATTLETRCDLIGINVADRAKIDPTNCGLIVLVFALALEDSATYRGFDAINNPMHSAIAPEILRIICETTNGREAMRQVVAEDIEAGGIFAQLNAIFEEKAHAILRGQGFAE